MYRTHLALGLCKCQREMLETICDLWMGRDNVPLTLVGKRNATMRRFKMNHESVWLVRRLPMRLHDGDFDEKEREEGEDGGLDKADEELEHHHGDRRHIGQEVNDY